MVHLDFECFTRYGHTLGRLYKNDTSSRNSTNETVDMNDEISFFFFLFCSFKTSISYCISNLTV